MLQSERLRALRQELDQNQSEIASALNMTREAYSMYETGRRQPPNETLVKLAGHYRVSLDFLAGRTDIPFSFAGLPPKLREAVIQLFELEEENLEVVLSVIRLAHGRGSSR